MKNYLPSSKILIHQRNYSSTNASDQIKWCRLLLLMWKNLSATNLSNLYLLTSIKYILIQINKLQSCSFFLQAQTLSSPLLILEKCLTSTSIVSVQDKDKVQLLKDYWHRIDKKEDGLFFKIAIWLLHGCLIYKKQLRSFRTLKNKQIKTLECG